MSDDDGGLAREAAALDAAARADAVDQHGLRAAQRLYHAASCAAEDTIEAMMDGDDERADRRLEDARRFGRVAGHLLGEQVRDAGGGGRCRVCGCTDPMPCVDDVTGEACGWAEADLCSACARPQVDAV